MKRNATLLATVAAVLVGVCITFATPASAVPTPPRYTATTYAGYGATSVANSVSADLHVPSFSCAGQQGWQEAGQQSGVQLIDATGAMHLTADIRTFCVGRFPIAMGEFSVPRNSQSFLIPALLMVRPGDDVTVTVSTDASGSSAQIVNRSRHMPAASAHGDPLPGAHPYVVSSLISANARGQVQLYGPPAPGSPSLPGPVPSTPLVFRNVRVDGSALAGTTGLFAVDWVNTTTTLAHTSDIAGNGTDFTITFTV